MEISEFDDNLPRTFINLRCLKKESKMKRWSQTGEEQQLMVSPRVAVAVMIQIMETDTSPVKTMTVLQSSQLGINISEGVRHMNVDTVGFLQII